MKQRLYWSVEQSQISRYCGVCLWPSADCPKEVMRGFSRSLMLNRRLTATRAAQSVSFIDTFNIFWERRHLFKADGFCLNKSGLRRLTFNIIHSVHLTSVPPSKDDGRGKPKQPIRQPSGGGRPEMSFEQRRQPCQVKESSTPPSSPLPKEECPPPHSQQEEPSTLHHH